MEHSTNRVAPEASTDERASSPSSRVGPTAADSALAGFVPVPLRYRSDGWTPARQVEFLEALADTGIIRQAAAMVGMTEQSVARLRRRDDARAFDLACEAAQRRGARERILATAYERAIEGTLKGHYYHGELKSQERVYDNRLLTYLIGKVAHLLAPRPESLAVDQDWERWLKAVAAGDPPPGEPAQEDLPYTGEELWEGECGRIWTSYPPPEGFMGQEKGKWGDEDYCRTVSEDEERTIAEDGRRIRAFQLAKARAERDRYFGFPGNPESLPKEAEPSEPSNDRDAPAHPLKRLEESEGDLAAARHSLRLSSQAREPLRKADPPAPVDVYVNPGLSGPEPSSGEPT
jgi:hypothetical protein